MELFFFAALLGAFLVYVARTKWEDLRTHLAIVWVLMAAHLVGLIAWAAITRI